MRVLRVGGVAEPFNLPWLLAFETGAFRELGVEVTFSHYGGGTGEMIGALDDGSLDIATLLTEGAVTAIARGSRVRLHSAFTSTPLRWGIHVGPKATQTKVRELERMKFAISRYGSGSELMAYELADQQGWKLKASQFVEVGGVDGAADALSKRKAHIFLWERFVTAPLVKQGVFKRIGEITTPWPAFYTAARGALLQTDQALVDRIVEITLQHAAELEADPDAAVDQIVDRYGMTRRDARSWLDGVDWLDSVVVNHEDLAAVSARMAELGRIPEPIDTAALI